MSEQHPDPLSDYMEVYGEPDAVGLAEVELRLAKYFEQDADELVHEQEHDAELARRPVSRERWRTLFAASLATSVVAAGLLGVMVVRTNSKLAEVEQQLGRANERPGLIVDTTAGPDTRENSDQPEPDTSTDGGPGRLETRGDALRIALAYESTATVEPDSSIASLRNDERGAQFELLRGAIALDVEHIDGVEWSVRAGEYEVTAIGTDFRVERTHALPLVEVREGTVLVTGGELPPHGVLVSARVGNLDAALDEHSSEASARRNGATEGTSRPAPVPEDLSALSIEELDERFGEAKQAGDSASAERLLRELIGRSGENPTIERAYLELALLLDTRPTSKAEVLRGYLQRFPSGRFARKAASLYCGQQQGEAAQACRSEYAAQLGD